MDAMQATLADSAVYVRYLRKKVLELEVEATRNAARSLLRDDTATQGERRWRLFECVFVHVYMSGRSWQGWQQHLDTNY